MRREYLQQFDEVFNCNLSEKIRINMPVLDKLYEYFENDIYVANKTQRDLAKKRANKYEVIMKSLNKHQQELFDEYFQIENDIAIDIEKQLFTFGFLIAKELDFECNEILKRKNE
ncbi:MAG: hypothetical protein IJH12_10735 [Clostridia bacterium]|nr:hypothetical protein [Clostridia bacterium]